MARAKGTALGLDLFGLDRAALAIRSDRKGVTVVHAALDATTPLYLVGTVAPARAVDLVALLNTKTPGIGSATVGINEMPGKAEFALANISSADRILADRRKYAAAVKGLPGRQGKVDAPFVAVIPIPNRRDGKWDPFSAAVRPQLAVAAIDAVQNVVPAIRPAVDLRSIAALRAFMASSVEPASDYAAFIHVDALDLTTVLLSRGEVSFIQRSAGGVLGLAQKLAAIAGVTLDAAWSTLATDGLGVFGDAGRQEVLSLIDMEVRNLDGRLKTLWEANAKSADRTDPPRVETVYLSGPLADDPVASEIDLGGGIAINAFRPVADLLGAPADVARHAGRLTVAYGLALNSVALAGATPDRRALATDLTALIELDLLPADLRSESGMPEAPDVAAAGSRGAKASKPKRQLSPVAQRRIAASMYVVGLGYLGATAYPMWQRSRIEKDTATLRIQAQRMSAAVFEDSTKLEQFRAASRKVGALHALRDLGAMPHEQLAALARAASLSNGHVWLTRIEANTPGVMALAGRAESLSSFATYFQALKTDPAFVGVGYTITNGTSGPAGVSPAPTDTSGTFPFTMTLTLHAPSAIPATVSPLDAALHGPGVGGAPGSAPAPRPASPSGPAFSVATPSPSPVSE